MRNTLLVAFFVLAGALTLSAQNTIYFPHIADGQEGGGFFWKTTIFLTNPAPSGSAVVSGAVEIFAPNRTPLAISFVNESNQPVGNSFQVAGGQTRKLISTAVAPLGVGFGVVTSNGIVGGTAVFSRFGPGERIISEAAVPAVSTPVLRQAVIVDTTQGFDTGVAFVHTGVSALPVTLTLLNTEGVQVRTTTTNQTSPVFHSAGFVSSLFAPAPPPTVGTLQISSTGPMAAVGLRFASTGAFTTVPTITLASLMQPAMQWFEQKKWTPAFSSVARLFAGLQYWRT